MSNIYASGITTTLSTGAGSNGTYLTTGSTGSTWANTSLNAVISIPADGNKVIIDEKASLEVKGKLKINGVDLEERLKTIEDILQIPERDIKLEAQHPKLKKMYEDYIHELKKYRTWEILKGDHDA